jgi:hypothetical protein
MTMLLPEDRPTVKAPIVNSTWHIADVVVIRSSIHFTGCLHTSKQIQHMRQLTESALQQPL